jgi:MFS family permease
MMTAKQLWTHPDARRYLTGQALSLLGDSAMWLACGIWVKTLTGSNAAAGLTFLFFSAPAVLAPLAGLLVDRVSRKRLLVVANLAGVAVLAPLLLVHRREDVWLIYTVMAFYGLLNVTIAPAQSALLAGLLPSELLADANGALRTIQESLRVLAPLVGAGLFTLVGGAGVAFADMLTFLAAAGFVAALRHREPRAATQAAPRTGRVRHAAAEIGAGFRFVGATPALRRLTIACAVATLAVGFADATGYAVISEGLHRPPQFIGITQMVQGIGAIAGGLTAASAMRRLGEVRVALAGLLLLAAWPVLVATSSLPVVLAGKVGAGVAVPWIVIAVLTLLQRLSPNHLQGRVYTAFEVGTTGPQTVGIGLGAALIATIDYRFVLAGVALAIVLSALLLTRTRPGPWPAAPGLRSAATREGVALEATGPRERSERKDSDAEPSAGQQSPDGAEDVAVERPADVPEQREWLVRAAEERA